MRMKYTYDFCSFLQTRRNMRIFACLFCSFEAEAKEALLSHFRSSPQHFLQLEELMQTNLGQEETNAHQITEQKISRWEFSDEFYSEQCSLAQVNQDFLALKPFNLNIFAYKCTSCQFVNDDLDVFKAHQRLCQRAIVENKFNCDQCESKFATLVSLRSHFNQKHYGEEFRKVEATESNNVMHLCQTCPSFWTNDLARYEKHLKTKQHLENEKSKADTCNYDHSEDNSNHFNLAAVDEPEFAAENITDAESDETMAKASDGTIFDCEKCNFSTKYRIALNRHMKTGNHPQLADDTEKFSCDVCQFSTKHNNNLSKHFQSSKHKRALREVSFEQEANLSKPENQISMETDYSCESCSFKTSFEKTYQSHLKSRIHKENQSHEENVKSSESKQHSEFVPIIIERVDTPPLEQLDSSALISTDQPDKKNVKKPVDDFAFTLICDLCGAKFKTAQGKGKHVKSCKSKNFSIQSEPNIEEESEEPSLDEEKVQSEPNTAEESGESSQDEEKKSVYFDCEYCDRTFVTSKGKLVHMGNCTSSKKGKPEIKASKAEPQDPAEKMNIDFNCDICGRSFASNKGLKVHMVTCKFKCAQNIEEESSVIIPNSDESPMEIKDQQQSAEEESPVITPNSDKSPMEKKSFAMEEQVSSSDEQSSVLEKLWCNLCNFIGKNTRSLRLHGLRAHKKENLPQEYRSEDSDKFLPCPRCYFKTKDENSLDEHLKTQHKECVSEDLYDPKLVPSAEDEDNVQEVSSLVNFFQDESVSELTDALNNELPKRNNDEVESALDESKYPKAGDEVIENDEVPLENTEDISLTNTEEISTINTKEISPSNTEDIPATNAAKNTLPDQVGPEKTLPIQNEDKKAEKLSTAQEEVIEAEKITPTQAERLQESSKEIETSQDDTTMREVVDEVFDLIDMPITQPRSDSSESEDSSKENNSNKTEETISKEENELSLTIEDEEDEQSSFDSKVLNDSLSSNASDYVCKLCDYQTENKVLFLTHSKSLLHCKRERTAKAFLLKQMKTFQCHHCEYTSFHREVLKIHERTHKRRKRSRSDDDDGTIIREKTLRMCCAHCRFTTKDLDAMMMHNQEEHSEL